MSDESYYCDSCGGSYSYNEMLNEKIHQPSQQLVTRNQLIKAVEKMMRQLPIDRTTTYEEMADFLLKELGL